MAEDIRAMLVTYPTLPRKSAWWLTWCEARGWLKHSILSNS